MRNGQQRILMMGICRRTRLLYCAWEECAQHHQYMHITNLLTTMIIIGSFFFYLCKRLCVIFNGFCFCLLIPPLCLLVGYCFLSFFLPPRPAAAIKNQNKKVYGKCHLSFRLGCVMRAGTVLYSSTTT